MKGIKARPQPIEGNKMCLLKNVYRRRRQVKKKERERERDSKNISKRTVGGGGGNFVEAHSNAENSPERSTAWVGAHDIAILSRAHCWALLLLLTGGGEIPGIPVMLNSTPCSSILTWLDDGPSPVVCELIFPPRFIPWRGPFNLPLSLHHCTTLQQQKQQNRKWMMKLMWGLCW